MTTHLPGAPHQGQYGLSPSLHDRLAGFLPLRLGGLSLSMRLRSESSAIRNNKSQRSGVGVFKRLFSVTTVLILAWVCTIWWGERLTFSNSLAACQWHHWEQWPSEARPHRVVLIADPQLVDPHTYPGRPWPLSSLTIAYTDLYLRRSYRYLQQHLEPDTLFFLGDLFDGGREWGTPHSSSPEERYKRYGNTYWMKEYNRFQRIFVDPWLNGRHDSLAEPRGRKIIASLPGNHDLGFAAGIQGPVKERFQAYFGNGNRIDIIGNHSFVSVDTVSLSAMDQADPNTGSSGAGDGTSSSAANHDIWASTEEFLSGVREERSRAAKREIRSLAGLDEQHYRDEQLLGFAPNISDLTPGRTIVEKTDLTLDNAAKSFPSILLTHVPLYRAPGTDCGTQRERGSAIPVQAGYQYQNVLTPLISKDIISKLGVEDVTQIYSGDDHDYCEIEHGEFTGRIKEITVKSISLAMGVRKPGFLAVSLHNPIDIHPTAKTDQGEPGVKRDTIQNKLCLLPDQLSIFARYAMLLILTLLILAIKTLTPPTPTPHTDARKPLLPLTTKDHPPPTNNAPTSLTSSTSSSSFPPNQPLLTTTNTSSSSTQSKLPPYGNLPPHSRSASPSKSKSKLETSAFAPASGVLVISTDGNTSSSDDEWGTGTGTRGRRQPGRGARKRKQRGVGRLLGVFGLQLMRVAVPVLVFYTWMVFAG